MTSDEQRMRQRIQDLLREAAALFSGKTPPDLDPALPKIRSAVELAEQLDDKTPLLICQSNLAHMHAVCGRGGDAVLHIDQAIKTAMESDLAIPIRNFVFVKFIEIAVLLGREHKRSLTYGRALVQSALEDEENEHQFYAAVHNLSVVCHELLKCPDWGLALASWLLESAPNAHPITVQAKRYAKKITDSFPEELRHAWESEIEANRDALVTQATEGYLPRFAHNAGDDGPGKAS